MSLEDVFLKLTTQESDVAVASDVVASEQPLDSARDTQEAARE
jgi:hypothetical protein